MVRIVFDVRNVGNIDRIPHCSAVFRRVRYVLDRPEHGLLLLPTQLRPLPSRWFRSTVNIMFGLLISIREIIDVLILDQHTWVCDSHKHVGKRQRSGYSDYCCGRGL